jgi:hypothetical protein
VNFYHDVFECLVALHEPEAALLLTPEADEVRWLLGGREVAGAAFAQTRRDRVERDTIEIMGNRPAKERG